MESGRLFYHLYKNLPFFQTETLLPSDTSYPFCSVTLFPGKLDQRPLTPMMPPRSKLLSQAHWGHSQECGQHGGSCIVRSPAAHQSWTPRNLWLDRSKNLPSPTALTAYASGKFLRLVSWWLPSFTQLPSKAEFQFWGNLVGGLLLFCGFFFFSPFIPPPPLSLDGRERI